jgi:1-acyl-sn-glycerol-3-phosphate acyltransferase
MRRLLSAFLEALFRVLFTYECVGEEKLPASGPAVVASNHPSYLDPILLSLQARRPIRFMAWDALFRVPLLGVLLRLFGAIPVDVRKGKGKEAYERAKALVEAGEIVGIFPEGKRSRSGWMEPQLREGAVRLARETGALLYPATITGAFRAWPHFRLLPRPARVRVRFHDPIDPSRWRDEPEEAALPAMLAELRQRVERSLLPGVKADLRLSVIYRRPSPWLRPHEYLPPLLLALLVFWKTRLVTPVLPAYAYLAYLLADHYLIPQGRLVKWVRNSSPVVFLVTWGLPALEAGGLTPQLAPRALAAVMLAALFPYFYDRGFTALSFVKGFSAAFCLGAAALWFWPTPVGLHVALAAFAAAFAWEQGSVFWHWSVPILVAYAATVGIWLGGGANLIPSATAGLVAWLLVRVFPHREPALVVEEPEEVPTGLGLLR